MSAALPVEEAHGSPPALGSRARCRSPLCALAAWMCLVSLAGCAAGPARGRPEAGGAAEGAGPPAPGGGGPVAVTGEAPAGSAAPQAEPEAGSQAGEGEGEGTSAPIPVSGWLSTGLRGRWTRGEHDVDLTTLLGLAFGDATRHPVTVHLSGRVKADLAGDQDGDEPTFFAGLENTFSSGVDAQLHTAYADVHAARGLELLRLGRQWTVETPELAWFDGVALETRARGSAALVLGLYGGVPVRLYESSPAGDALAGAYLESRPWAGGRARVDYMHLRDDARFAEHENDLLGLRMDQRAGERLRLDARFTHLDGEERDLRLGATWLDAERDLLFSAQWYRLFTTQGNLALELDPFHESLHDLHPYDQVRLLAAKGLDEHLRIEGGVDLRRVRDSADEGAFNREFDRWFATFFAEGLLPAGFSASVTGELYDADDADVRTWGLDLDRRGERGLDLGFGSYYALYVHDVFLDVEREHVRVYYLRIGYSHSRALRHELRYELEDGDGFPTFHELRWRTRWSF